MPKECGRGEEGKEMKVRKIIPVGFRTDVLVAYP
jgi:hypothetical protein